MSGEPLNRPQCADCGSTSVVGTFNGEPYCTSCFEPRALDDTTTVEKVVFVLERLAQAGVEAEVESVASLTREVREAQETSKELVRAMEEARNQLAASGPRQRAISPMFGDSIIQDRLSELLDGLLGPDPLADSPYRLGGEFMTLCRDIDTMRALLERAMQDPQTMSVVQEALWGLLFQLPRGEEFSILEIGPTFIGQYLVEPWRSRLGAIRLAHVILGLGRMSELSSHLISGGLFPEASYTERERQLYLEIEGPNRRRMRRAWHFLRELAEGELAAREDRAELLMHCWFITPLSWSVKKYLRLLYPSFVAGHYAETIVLCRSVLEGAVNGAIPSDERVLCTRDKLYPSMKDKLRHLVAVRRLPRSLERTALDVWLRGSKAVHDEPDMYKDSASVYATIQSTLQIATELERFAVQGDSE